MTDLPPEMSDAAAAVENRRLALELDLLGSILAEPRTGIEACHALPFFHDAIENDDLRLMYLTVEEFAHRGRTVIVRAIKRIMCLTDHWDAGAPREDRTGHWSDASLAALAYSFPSAAHVPHLAKELMRIDGTMRRAASLYAEAMRELREAV